MKMIKLIAGAIGMAVSASSMAVGYSSTLNPLSGDLPSAGSFLGTTQPVERHWVQSYTLPGDCGGVCQFAELQESEVLIQLNVVNQTGCDDTAGPLSSGTRQCIQAPAVEDVYSGNTDGGGTNYNGGTGAAIGATPVIEHLNIFAPFCSAPGTGCFTYVELGAGGTSALFNLIDWSFTTEVSGKLKTGHIIGFANVFGNEIVGTFNLDTDTFTTYYGPEAEAQTKIDCLVDTPTLCASATFNLSRSAPFEYVTAGMAQLDLGKAVPVPAFAAAALGLGLVGITLLTGRRRQIK